MFKALIQEAAALASLALFIAISPYQPSYWGICDRSRRTARGANCRPSQSCHCLVTQGPSIHSSAPLYTLGGAELPNVFPGE